MTNALRKPKVESFHSPEYVFWKLGQSVDGRELKALAIGPDTDASTNSAATNIPYQPAQAGFPWILVASGLYGDEHTGVKLVSHAWQHFIKHYEYRLLGTILYDRINPDAIERQQGLNARNVDLNHNFPTRNWKDGAKLRPDSSGAGPGSEPEVQALASMISACKPRTILLARTSDKPMIVCDGPAHGVAEALAKICGYPIRDAKAPPGSLGLFAGQEQRLPVVSIGIPRDMDEKEIIAKHMPLVEATITYWEERV